MISEADAVPASCVTAYWGPAIPLLRARFGAGSVRSGDVDVFYSIGGCRSWAGVFDLDFAAAE